MRRLSYSLIALFALISAPQLVCQIAVSEPLRAMADIERFEAADLRHFPVPGTIVFAGSSSIAMWQTLNKDFGDTPVLNRVGETQLAACWVTQAGVELKGA